MRRYLLATACLAASVLRAEPPATSLPNPGFEEAAPFWGRSKEDETLGLSKITSEAARCGLKGLRIEQGEDGPGSWCQSRRTSTVPGVTYQIEFWARTINTSNVAVFVHFFDANAKPISVPGGPPFIIKVLPESPEWTVYRLDVVAPSNAESITLAVRCNKNQATMADFDDFSITPIITPARPSP
jgi:hypothetical protein